MQLPPVSSLSPAYFTRHPLALVYIAGLTAFLLISLAQIYPPFGAWAWSLSMLTWIALAIWLSSKTQHHFREGLLLGLTTGFAGALASFIIDLLLNAFAPTSTSSGFALGAFFGLFYWPLLGALMCGLWAVSLGRRLFFVQPNQPSSTLTHPLSADGLWRWDGTAWQSTATTLPSPPPPLTERLMPVSLRPGAPAYNLKGFLIGLGVTLLGLLSISFGLGLFGTQTWCRSGSFSGDCIIHHPGDIDQIFFIGLFGGLFLVAQGSYVMYRAWRRGHPKTW